MRDYDFGNESRLASLLTDERLQSYVACSQSLERAIALYEWNIDVSAAVLATCAAVEVVVRNAMDHALQQWALAQGHDDWLEAAPFDAKGRAAIAIARRYTSAKGRGVPGLRPTAELTFGFWRYLVTGRYLTTLWMPGLRHAFPFGSEDPQSRRSEVHFALQQLVFVRNRAAHHEPIHTRNLLRDNDLAIGLAAMVDPVAGEWVAQRSTIPAIVAVKPTFAA